MTGTEAYTAQMIAGGAQSVVVIRALKEPRRVKDSLRLTMSLRCHGFTCAGPSYCDGKSPILFSRGAVEIGRRVSFRNIAIRSEIGAVRGGRLSIGEGTFINEGVSIVAHKEIRIGNNCLIGEYVGIFDTEHHKLTSADQVRIAPVTVADNVWIGRGAILLPGVSIGSNSVIGAGSVVTADVAANSVVAGAPARMLRTFPTPEGWIRR